MNENARMKYMFSSCNNYFQDEIRKIFINLKDCAFEDIKTDQTNQITNEINEMELDDFEIDSI